MSNKMRVAMYYSNDDIRIEEIPVPNISRGEVLVKVESSGICGSDLMEWYRLPKAPLVLGHEVAGKIVEVGEDVIGFSVGDMVVVTHHVPCNECHYCLTDRSTLCDFIKQTSFDPGGFSELLRIPKLNVKSGMLKLPDTVSYDEGSFVEPLGCVVRALRKVDFKKGQTVAIIGSGITGLLNLGCVLNLGAKFVTSIDINGYKLNKALSMGADLALNANSDVRGEILKHNNDRLVDLVIVCIGVDSALNQAFEIVDKGGKILFFAPIDPNFVLNLPFNDYWWSGVSLHTSYAASPTDMSIALDLIKENKVDVKKLITHKLPLSETKMGFNLLKNSTECLKVVINPEL